MNTTTNTTNNTTSAQPAGSGVGNKIKGAMEYVHGAGENLRGTALGVVDTLGSSGSSRSDEIARQGRMQMERGLANMKGSNAPHNMGPSATSTSSGYPQTAQTGATGTQPYPMSGQNAPNDGGSAAYPRDKHPQGYGAGNQNISTGPAPTYPGPNHHRDDAITGPPQPQFQQGGNMGQGQLDPMQAAHRQADPRQGNPNQVTI